MLISQCNQICIVIRQKISDNICGDKTKIPFRALRSVLAFMTNGTVVDSFKSKALLNSLHLNKKLLFEQKSIENMHPSEVGNVAL